MIFHGLNIIIYNNIIKIILRGRGKSRIDPGSEDGINDTNLNRPIVAEAEKCLENVSKS